MKKLFIVEVNYAYDVEAETREEAISEALQRFADNPPLADEVNIEIADEQEIK